MTHLRLVSDTTKSATVLPQAKPSAKFKILNDGGHWNAEAVIQRFLEYCAANGMKASRQDYTTFCLLCPEDKRGELPCYDAVAAKIIVLQSTQGFVQEA